jgi:hypothetical protein
MLRIDPLSPDSPSLSQRDVFQRRSSSEHFETLGPYYLEARFGGMFGMPFFETGCSCVAATLRRTLSQLTVRAEAI